MSGLPFTFFFLFDANFVFLVFVVPVNRVSLGYSTDPSSPLDMIMRHDKMARQVLRVFPNAPYQAVLRDLGECPLLSPSLFRTSCCRSLCCTAVL